MKISMKSLNPALAVITLTLAGCSASTDMGVSNNSGAGTGVPAASTPVAAVPEPDSGAANSAEPVAPVSQSNADEAMFVANAAAVSCDANADTFNDTMLAMVNNSRKVARMCGTISKAAVGSVTWSNRLTEAAELHAQDMVDVNFFDHTGSDGLGVSDRASGVGYTWRAIGENIAAGQMDIEEVHQGWLDSPGHCRNIMNTMFTEVGAACITTDAADYQSYWVVVFGDTF